LQLAARPIYAAPRNKKRPAGFRQRASYCTREETPKEGTTPHSRRRGFGRRVSAPNFYFVILIPIQPSAVTMMALQVTRTIVNPHIL
jgi:hypothetical protein